jgi:periplasmic divalent cation tolerance protein
VSKAAGIGAALIWCPFPDEDAALTAIHTMLDERLIACGNILPGMTSVFVWNGEKDVARETGVLLKTNTDLLDGAVLRLAELHPYEEPAVLGWPCNATAPGTLTWLAAIASKP